MEIGAGQFQPVEIAGPGDRPGRFDVEYHRQIGPQSPGGPAGDRLEVIDIEASACPLVGQH
ncbi:hypothetical protein SDC9_196895 [bioreactor metagenome]|uniref:Uncharacterized protein n=1 Tax=bioreactor metagenome TaxID=1076179 RepID=A0A645ID93_9ZZZZ